MSGAGNAARSHKQRGGKLGRALFALPLVLGGCTANLLRNQDEDAPAGSMALLERLVTEQSTQIQRATEMAAWASGYAIGLADRPRPLLRRRLR